MVLKNLVDVFNLLLKNKSLQNHLFNLHPLIECVDRKNNFSKIVEKTK